MLVADANITLVLSGNGDVLEPEDGVMAIGSGGGFALAAARDLHKHAPEMDASAIARRAMEVAAGICVFTNDSVLVETIEAPAG